MAKHRYPRSHDHQHTSRKCPLTPTRPGTGGPYPPGSPLASPQWGTPLISNPHPPTPKFGGPACMRPGARGTFAVTPVSGRPRRSRSPGSPSQPQVKAGVGSRSRECPRVCQGSTDVPPVAGGRVYGGTCGMSVDVRGIIRRRFLFTASSLKRTCVCVGGWGGLPDLHALPTDNPSTVHG